MTQRINALTVVLEKDIREDDVELITNAIRMLKYVLSVNTNVSDINSHIAYQRARYDIQDKLFEALKEK